MTWRGRAAFVVLPVLLGGCASRAVNTTPDPRVVLLHSIPDDADVTLNCNGDVQHARTPVRLAVPPGNGFCQLELSKEGYRPARARFDWYFVVTRGEALRSDEHHQLDPARVTSPGDILLFPLQLLGDRIQNAVERKLIPDYRMTIELLPSREEGR